MAATDLKNRWTQFWKNGRNVRNLILITVSSSVGSVSAAEVPEAFHLELA